MLQTLESPAAASAASSFRDQSLRGFRFMVQSRVLDEKMAGLYRANKMHGGVFLGKGQEALSVSLGLGLQPGDVFAPLIRDGAGRLAFGEQIIDAVRTYLGSALGPMRGRDGNVHRGYPRRGLLPMISHLGAMISVVNGVLIGHRFRKVTGSVGVACIGDGATSTGAFHEALNQAAVEKLPLVLVVANNQFAYSTPNSRQFACENLIDRALGYGVAGHEVDGTDLEACLKISGRAIAAARQGGGPQLVVASLLRLCGHGEHDDAHYIDASLKQSPLGRDCLLVAEDFLSNRHWASAEEMRQIRAEAAQLVDDAVAIVLRESPPDPYTENWCALASKHLSETFDACPALENP